MTRSRSRRALHAVASLLVGAGCAARPSLSPHGTSPPAPHTDAPTVAPSPAPTPDQTPTPESAPTSAPTPAPAASSVDADAAVADAPANVLPPTGPEVARPGVTRRGECFVRLAMVRLCHGAPLPEEPPPRQVELCDGCRTHRDCTAAPGGRCVELAGNTCSFPARVCRYPRDACSRCEGRPTFTRRGCVNDQSGHAVCALLSPPPPAAPDR